MMIEEHVEGKLRSQGRKMYGEGMRAEKHGKKSRKRNISKEIMEKECEGIYGREQ